MVRYVHHELGGGLAWLAGYVVGGAVAVMVRGSVPIGVDTGAKSAALAIGTFVLFALLHVSGIRGLSHARRLKNAEPMPIDVRVPRSSPWNPNLLVLFVPPCVMTYFWLENSLFLLLLPIDSLARAGAGVWWERRNGQLIWRGYYHREPWKLTYSPVSPPPPTRTATDAPPA